jgi:hypothetical protein
MVRFKHLISGAVALAISHSVFALTQAQVDTVAGTANEIFVAGSSALDNDIANLMTSNCQSGTYNVYQDIDANGVKGALWKAYTCQLNSAAPVPSALQNQQVIIHKREKEGSVYGSLPIATEGYIEFMNIKSTRASGACVVDGTSFDCTIGPEPVQGSGVSTFRDLPRHDAAFGGQSFETAANNDINEDECDYNTVAGANPLTGGSYTADTLCRRGSLGLSDTEAEMFLGSNINARPNASDPNDVDDYVKLTSAQIGHLTRKRTAGQVFGIAVSNSVFTALQTAQGITPGAPVTDGTASNWPSLGKDQVRQLLSGSASQWTQVIQNIGLSGNLNNIAICRRDQGSGTQASANQFFFNYPCDTNNQAPQRDTGGAPLPSGLYAQENFSSNYVKYCLNQAEAGQLPGSSGTQQYGAIGLLAANGDPSSTNTPLVDTWKWVKIDGNAPTLSNAILGKYDDWYEFQIAYNNQSGALNANESAFATFVVSALGTTTQITAAGDKGIAALSANGYTWDDGVNNNAGTFPANDFGNIPKAVMGGKHGGGAGTTFFTTGTPTSCRLIQNYPDSANLPNRSM